MPVIQIEHLKKNYGKHVGTRDVTFSVDAGEIYGFVGPNGAGKSTTIKVLMGFIFATGGSAKICGLDAQRDTKAIKAFTGYVPSDVRLYANLKIKELLARNAGFYKKNCTDETQRLCALFGVDENKHFGELSTGNKKKVSIVCALAAKPKVIILDEPTSGLDPVIRRVLFEELKRQTANGATVLLSSHNLSEVQEYCDRVAFIRDGAILAVTDLKAAQNTHKVITVVGGKDIVPDGFTLVTHTENQRTFYSTLDGNALLTELMALSPKDFTVENESMEEHFWALYGKEVPK